MIVSRPVENLKQESIAADPGQLLAAKRIFKQHATAVVSEACGLSGPTILGFISGRVKPKGKTLDKILQGMQQLDGLDPTRTNDIERKIKQKRRFFGRSDMPHAVSRSAQPVSEQPTPPFEEDEMSEAPVQTPVRILAPAARPVPPGSGVRTDLKFSGDAEDVKRAANALGMSEAAPRGEARPEAVQHALDFWLKDGGTVVRVDRIRPREVARVHEPPAPTAIGKIIQQVEDKCGGGLFKIRAYPPDGRAPVQYQFDIPGAPTDIKEEPAKSSEDSQKKPSAADAIDDEVRQLEAKKRKLVAERELEEFKNPKEKVPAVPAITAEAIAAIVERTVAARLEPLRQDRDRKELKDDILGSIAPALKELNAKIESAIPKQKSQELLMLEDQLEQMRDQLEAIASRRGAAEEKDPFDHVSRIVKLIRDLGGSGGEGKPKDRSELIETALEEMLLQKLRGETGGDSTGGEKDEEDVLKFVVKEFAPAFRDYIHQEMEIKKQNQGASPQQAAANQAFLNQKVQEATARVMDQMKSQQQQKLTHQASASPQDPKQATHGQKPQAPPQQAQARSQAPVPSSTIPPSELQPDTSIPEQRDPRWVNETLRTLIREVGEGFPRECEWLGLVMDYLPEPILDQLCEVETGDELRSVLAPYSELRYLDEVQRLGKDKRVKAYIERGLMTIKDEWLRIKNGDVDEGEGEEDGEDVEEITEEEPPKV